MRPLKIPLCREPKGVLGSVAVKSLPQLLRITANGTMTVFTTSGHVTEPL